MVMIEVDVTACLGLFFAAFIAATVLPAQSELVLAGLIVVGKQPAWLLIAIATAGNSFGSSANWLIGWYLYRFRDHRWFPIKASSLNRAIKWYQKYGRWSLLCSWMPVIGDPLTLVAGALREPFWSFFIIVFAAKLARYILVAGFTLQWVVG